MVPEDCDRHGKVDRKQRDRPTEKAGGLQIVSRDRNGRTASKAAKLGVMSMLMIVELSWREKGKRRSISMSAEQVQEIAWLQQQIDNSRRVASSYRQAGRYRRATQHPSHRGAKSATELLKAG